ncbi:MAG TPA: hypothetical protein VGX03_25660 [Candidatus Binatia bacterium]|jgi:hypothetical protein|nr:hypothetical protein [Candidatus Binatia bacterium]
MKTTVGIFSRRQDAANAVRQLGALGFTHDHLSILTPEASNKELDAVPATQTEQPGMGQALGGVIGGASGLFWGGATGLAATNFFVPGVGPILAIGLAYTALSGILGAATGAAAGGALEEFFATGLPQDELFVYEDALRQGRTVVIVLTDDTAPEETVRDLLMQAGAESLDAARDQWWVGLRDAEEAAYDAPDGEFSRIESTYRVGFEAALQPQVGGRSYEQASDYLREHYSAVYLEEPFRRGYERGQAHQQGLLQRYGK